MSKPQMSYWLVSL